MFTWYLFADLESWQLFSSVSPSSKRQQSRPRSELGGIISMKSLQCRALADSCTTSFIFQQSARRTVQLKLVLVACCQEIATITCLLLLCWNSSTANHSGICAERYFKKSWTFWSIFGSSTWLVMLVPFGAQVHVPLAHHIQGHLMGQLCLAICLMSWQAQPSHWVELRCNRNLLHRFNIETFDMFECLRYFLQVHSQMLISWKLFVLTSTLKMLHDLFGFFSRCGSRIPC